MRKDILTWFLKSTCPQAIIGGDLNLSVPSLDAVLKVDRSIRYCYEADHCHGDIAIVKNVKIDVSKSIVRRIVLTFWLFEFVGCLSFCLLLNA